MECFNCGALLTGKDFCEKCGVDVKIYKKIIKTSNAFYNEGLERASVRDLSGAASSLKKSLELNKLNINARNLLGLVYFEMGETVAALSEWVISKNCQSRNNEAGHYLSEVQSNTAMLDTINQTIKKYNQALQYCRQDSRDLAAIQLKKVLSLNPKMVKGHQLLALLYIQEGKYDLAKKSLASAARVDKNNTTTLRYMREVERQLKEQNPKKKKNDDLISYQSGNDTIIMPANFKDNTAGQTIINIIIGIALGVAIMVFLFLPNINQKAKSDANDALKAANDTISTKEQSIASLENKVEDLTKELETVKEDSQEVETKLSSYENLLGAYSAFSSENIDGAGDSLSKVKEEDLSGTAKTIYNDISGKVNEKYLATMYQEGYSAYTKGSWQEAIDKLSKVVEMQEDYQNGNAVYYLAQSYRRTEELEKAFEYYQVVVKSHPGTERARVAQNFINSNPDLVKPQGAGDEEDNGDGGEAEEENGREGNRQPGAGPAGTPQ